MYSWCNGELPKLQSYPRFIMKMLQKRAIIVFAYEVFCIDDTCRY